MLRAARRVRQAPRPVVSAEFRARARARFAERVSADAMRARARRGSFFRSFGTAFRPIAVPVTIAVAMLFVIGTVGTASASALPGTTLYPAKLTVERLQLLLAYTPEQQTQAHLAIAAARLREAQAENHLGNATQIPSLLQSSQDQLAAAEAAAAKIKSSGYHEQVSQTIATLRSEQRGIPPVVAASRAHPSPVVAAAKPAEDQPKAESTESRSKSAEPLNTPGASVPSDRSEIRKPPNRRKKWEEEAEPTSGAWSITVADELVSRRHDEMIGQPDTEGVARRW